MKITKVRLKQIIKEELSAVLTEAKVFDPALGFDVDPARKPKPKAKLPPEPVIPPDEEEFDVAMELWDKWREWIDASDNLDIDDSDVVLLVKWMASRSIKYGGRKYIHLLRKFASDGQFPLGDIRQAINDLATTGAAKSTIKLMLAALKPTKTNKKKL